MLYITTTTSCPLEITQISLTIVEGIRLKFDRRKAWNFKSHQSQADVFNFSLFPLFSSPCIPRFCTNNNFEFLLNRTCLAQPTKKSVVIKKNTVSSVLRFYLLQIISGRKINALSVSLCSNYTVRSAIFRRRKKHQSVRFAIKLCWLIYDYFIFNTVVCISNRSSSGRGD